VGLLAAARRWKRARVEAGGGEGGDYGGEGGEAGGEGGEAGGEGDGGGEGGDGDKDGATAPTARRLHLPSGCHVWCHSPSEAAFIHGEIFERRCYLPRGSGITLPGSGSPSLIIDAGANIGLFSLWVARHAPLAQVLAFEPAPATFELLERNLADAAVLDRVAALPLALGATAGAATLAVFPSLPGNSTLHPHLKQAEVYTPDGFLMAS